MPVWPCLWLIFSLCAAEFQELHESGLISWEHVLYLSQLIDALQFRTSCLKLQRHDAATLETSECSNVFVHSFDMFMGWLLYRYCVVKSWDTCTTCPPNRFRYVLSNGLHFLIVVSFITSSMYIEKSWFGGDCVSATHVSRGCVRHELPGGRRVANAL